MKPGYDSSISMWDSICRAILLIVTIFFIFSVSPTARPTCKNDETHFIYLTRCQGINHCCAFLALLRFSFPYEYGAMPEGPQDHTFELRRKIWRLVMSYLSPQLKCMIFRCSNTWSFDVFICILHLLRVYHELTMWPAPRWLVAQLVLHCTGFAEVIGSNSIEAWMFFRLQLCNCFSCVYNCYDQSCCNIFLRSSNIYMLFY